MVHCALGGGAALSYWLACRWEPQSCWHEYVAGDLLAVALTCRMHIQ